MSVRAGPPDPTDPLEPYRRPGRARNASDIGRLTRRHVARILAVILAAAIYLPAMGLMAIQVAGGAELQELFDWLIGRCGATCSTREALATAIQIAPIIVTAPVLALIAWIWVKRSYRDDRDVSAIDHHFETMPERVSPYAIGDVEESDRYLYRDRQGRLRPVYRSDSPSP